MGAREGRGLGVLRPGLGLLESDALLLQFTSSLFEQPGVTLDKELA